MYHAIHYSAPVDYVCLSFYVKFSIVVCPLRWMVEIRNVETIVKTFGLYVKKNNSSDKAGHNLKNICSHSIIKHHILNHLLE